MVFSFVCLECLQAQVIKPVLQILLVQHASALAVAMEIFEGRKEGRYFSYK